MNPHSTPLPHLIAHFNERPAALVAVKFKRQSIWVEWDWKEYQKNIEMVFHVLKSKNIKSGDYILIMAQNSIEWALIDFAAQSLGAITVPVYPNCSDSDLLYILKEISPDLIFIDKGHMAARFPKAAESKTIQYSELWNLMNEAAQGEHQFDEFKRHCFERKLSDVATIAYTSGTSGTPKGICLTHKQILSELSDVAEVFPITSQDVTLSFLPYAHILGRVELWLSAYAGFTLAFCESIEQIKKNILEIKPTVLIAVPRIFEKIYGSVISKLNASQINRVVQHFEGQGLLASLAIAPARIFMQKKIKDSLIEALGGRLKYAISGGAPLPKDVAHFFERCDVLLLEGYGLTETTGAICVNTPNHYHFGTVGKPLPDVEIKLGEDNEILVKSDKVFERYFDQNLGNGLDSEGFFATGDIGEWSVDGFLRITDRKKDLIKTSGGKYVAPQKIEGLFKKYPLISQVLIHGDKRKYIVALITLDPVELKSWALQKGIPFSRVADLIHSPQTENEVSKIVKSINADLMSFESIKNFHILDEEFTIAKGELTPSLKIRRKACEAHYKEQLDQLYSI